jgi:hypothetical protein
LSISPRPKMVAGVMPAARRCLGRQLDSR